MMISQDLRMQLQSLIEKKGMTLYDIEFLKENDSTILRVSLFKKDGITLDDCETISLLVSPILDVALENQESYFLEVSSPGVERTLKTPVHFLCSIGEKVEIKLHDKTILQGILKSYNNEILEIAPLQNKIKERKKQESDSKITNLSQNTSDITMKLQHSKQNVSSQFIPVQNCKKVKTLFEWKNYQKEIRS